MLDAYGPWGHLKQLLYCPFIVKFPFMLPCLTLTHVVFFWRWLVTWKGWIMQAGYCPARVRALPWEQTRKVPVLHSSYGNGRNYLGVSVTFEGTQRKHSVVLVTSSHTHVTLLPAVCLAEFTQFHQVFRSLRVPSRWASRRKRVWLQFCTPRPQPMISKQRT